MGMRPYWADYANHMLRFYCKNSDPAMIYCFKTKTDEKNWRSCQRVMDTLSERDRGIILFVYAQPLLLDDAVNEYLTVNPKIRKDAVWEVIVSVSKRVAQMRGLL